MASLLCLRLAAALLAVAPVLADEQPAFEGAPPEPPSCPTGESGGSWCFDGAWAEGGNRSSLRQAQGQDPDSPPPPPPAVLAELPPHMNDDETPSAAPDAGNSTGGRPSPESPRTDVAYGRQLSYGQWHADAPYAVYVRTGGGGTCSGTLWRGYVLTAGHCCSGAMWVYQIQSPSGSAKWIRAKWHRRQPWYSSNTYDACMLGLGRGWRTPHVQPILAQNEPSPGGRLHVVGFGRHERGDSGVPPRWGQNFQVVSKTHTGAYRLSTGPDSRRSSCPGDSGAGWQTWPLNGGKAVLVFGIHMSGYGCGRAESDPWMWPVSSLKSWINWVSHNQWEWGTER